jgi:hypothetical protein
VTIREEDRTEMFLQRHIDIPTGSRCCESHTFDKRLTYEAFMSLEPQKVQSRSFSSNDVQETFRSYKARLHINNYLDFDNCLSLSDADYVKLTGFTRAQHHEIMSYLPAITLKNSTTRSAQSALAYFLMKLKLGISDSVLASLVGINNRRQMSRIITSVRLALVRYFVPHYLGLAHITRQEVIDKHTSPIASRLLSDDRNPCILVLDGTYLYIQVRSNRYF